MVVTRVAFTQRKPISHNTLRPEAYRSPLLPCCMWKSSNHLRQHAWHISLAEQVCMTESARVCCCTALAILWYLAATSSTAVVCLQQLALCNLYIYTCHTYIWICNTCTLSVSICNTCF
jgi:hypothetical protein